MLLLIDMFLFHLRFTSSVISVSVVGCLYFRRFLVCENVLLVKTAEVIVSGAVTGVILRFVQQVSAGGLTASCGLWWHPEQRCGDYFQQRMNPQIKLLSSQSSVCGCKLVFEQSAGVHTHIHTHIHTVQAINDPQCCVIHKVSVTAGDIGWLSWLTSCLASS